MDEHKRPRPVRLTCCCCGASLIGRQWWNRDAGFGICRACIGIEERRQSPEEIRSCYGVEGVHYRVQPS